MFFATGVALFYICDELLLDKKTYFLWLWLLWLSGWLPFANAFTCILHKLLLLLVLDSFFLSYSQNKENETDKQPPSEWTQWLLLVNKIC